MTVLKRNRILQLGILFIVMCVAAYKMLSVPGKIYLHPDAYGYVYPALEYDYSGNLKLIYGRPFLWPLLLAAYPIDFFENFALLVNSILLASLSIPLALLSLDIIQTTRSRLIVFTVALIFVISLFCIYDNVSIVQWFYYILPEGIAITLSCWILYLIYYIVSRKPSAYIVLITALISTSIYYIKPAYLMYAIFGNLVCISRVLLDTQGLKKKIFISFGILVPALILTFANNVLVNKYDKAASERFKSGTIICFNAPVVFNQINGKSEKNWVDLSLLNRLGKIISRGSEGYGYPSLKYNSDDCLYSSEYNMFQDIDLKLGWDVAPSIIKPYAYLVFNDPLYIAERVIQQYIVGFKNPVYNNKSDIIEDNAVETFIGNFSNSTVEKFWELHQWNAKHELKSNFEYNIPGFIFITIVLSVIAINFLINHRSIIRSSVVVSLVLSSMFVTSFAATFDVHSYRDTLMPLFLYLLAIIIFDFITSINSKITSSDKILT